MQPELIRPCISIFKDQNCIKHLKEGLKKHLNDICRRKDVENSKKHKL